MPYGNFLAHVEAASEMLKVGGIQTGERPGEKAEAKPEQKPEPRTLRVPDFSNVGFRLRAAMIDITNSNNIHVRFLLVTSECVPTQDPPPLFLHSNYIPNP